MKKGQIEMIGLVLVVLLLLVGALFYLRFSFSPSTSVSSPSDLDVVRASNLLVALSHLSLSCKEEREEVSSLLVRCAHGESFCGVSSCSYLEEQLDPLIRGLGFRDYFFWVVFEDDTFFHLGACSLGIEPGTYTLFAENERYEAHFRICEL